MARSTTVSNDDGFGKIRANRSRTVKKFRRVKLVGTALLLLLVGMILAVPFALSSANLVTKVINRFAGLDPLHVEVGGISIGWLSPLKLDDIRVMDSRGAELVRVGEIETQMSLWNLATNYKNIRNVYIRQTRIAIDVQPETTSLEEALQPLLAKWQAVEPEVIEEPTGEPIIFSGTLQIEDVTVLARDSVAQNQWEFSISEAVIPLPDDYSTVPPVSFVGRIAEIDGQGNLILRSTGQFSAKIEPVKTQSAILDHEGGEPTPQLHLSLSTSGMPLEWMSLVKRRLSWLPIQNLSGSVTLQADVDVRSPTSMVANISTAQIDKFHIDAPEYLGKSGASLNQIRLVGDVQLVGELIQIDQLQFTSDVGYLRASAKSPLAFESPTLAQPWVPNSNFIVDGEIDLVRLLQVAPELIVMQDNTRLLSGKATLAVRQIPADGATDIPRASCEVRLGNLLAEINGTRMQWDDALQMSARVKPTGDETQGGSEFQVACKAEFCDVEGQGTLTQGQILAKIDFDKLENRLSQWIKLPTESLAGTANATVLWRQQGRDRVIATATVDTSPLTIVLPTGRLEEPAWKGEASALLQLKGMELVQIDRASLNLYSNNEKIDFSTSTPLRLVAIPAGSPPVPPTAAIANIDCDLGACINRSKVISGYDPGIDLAGRCILQLESTVDNWQLALQSASYEVNGLKVQGDGYSVNEPRIQGRYRGSLNTGDLAATRIDELIVQAESLALTAKDGAAEQNGYMRTGQAAIRIDPARLLKALETPDAQSDGAYTYGGDVTGQLQWWLNGEKVDWQITVDGKDLVVKQLPTNATAAASLVSTAMPSSSTVETLWSEPQVKADARGTYVFSNGSVDVPSITVQTEWIAMAGKSHYESNQVEMVASCDGQLTYDMQTVMTRLKPFVGDYAQVRGQRTEPFSVLWRCRNDSTGSWADALTASTNIGWDDANVVGIVLGKSTVPLTISNGLAATKAEIPISQGTMRWDIQSNLAAEPLIISQKPQMILERVAITPQMCQGWLKYVAPLLSEVAAIEGQLSLDVERAELNPFDYLQQTVSGKLYVHGATVGPGPLADQLIGIVRQIRAMRKGLTLDANTINDDLWLQMPEQKISFAVDKGTITHKDVQMKAGDVVITTSGGVTLDGKLQMVAQVPIQQDWIAENQMLASLAGQSISLPIGGTLQQPRVDFSAFTSISQQLISAAAQQAVQKQVDKGLNKILGPLQNQLEPLQQQIQALPGQLPSLPQLPQFPSFGIPKF